MTDTNPDYYKSKNSNLEAINVIEAFELDFHAGTAVKYILRNGKKDASTLELRKARWYISRKLMNIGEASGETAAHEAKKVRVEDFKALVADIENHPEDYKALHRTFGGAFFRGFKAAYEHLGLRFES